MNDFLQKRIVVKSRAFSLVEMILYVSILSILIIALLSSMIALFRAYKQMAANQIIDSSALLILDRVTSVLRSSDSIDFVNTTLNSSAGVLSLNAKTPAGVSYVAKFYVNGGVAKMDVGGVYEGQLTSSSTEVVSLMFRHIDTPVSDALRIELTLTADVNGYTKTENYYTTTVLKNSY